MDPRRAAVHRRALRRCARLVDLTADWAQEREAFGSAIAEYQGISFPLADSLTELHAARLLTYHAAHAFDVLEDRKVVHGKVSMAKLYASEMAGRVADRAVQALGGRGYMLENPAARFFRAACRPYLGGDERDPALDHLPWRLQARRRAVSRLGRRSASFASGRPTAQGSRKPVARPVEPRLERGL